jgi:hypothetical protein
MRLKRIWPSRPGHLSIGKWSLLAAVVAAAIIATVVFTGAGSSSATPNTHAQINQTKSAVVLNPPPHQMAQLNFLLGDYKCFNALGLTMSESTRKILDGNYYQMEIAIPIPHAGTYSAYWTLGWDSIDHNYIAQYFDNTGTVGTATSSGWQNGHFKLSGQYIDVVKPGGVSGISKGARITSQDDLVITGQGRYTDTSSYVQNGKWETAGTSDCQKI